MERTENKSQIHIDAVFFTKFLFGHYLFMDVVDVEYNHRTGLITFYVQGPDAPEHDEVTVEIETVTGMCDSKIQLFKGFKPYGSDGDNSSESG